ncbi:MAG: hypothetical protein L0Y44_07710, partial [Phycisphaerales bacterium]|nr:hypothetical protein [Phycisphaerales bacterium]
LNKLNRADEVMRQLESATYEAQQAGQKRAPGSSPPAGGGKPARIGQPIGSDGGFALAYQEAGKNNEARMAALHAMRDNSGTDLGPLDAQVFVHELYRGSPQEVRTLAQSILIEQFQTGPVVALQMVDQFADAPSTDQISQMIQEYTGAMLPETRSESWVVQARWVLVQHSLKLRPRPEVAIESLVRTLADSYARRHSLLIGQDHDPATVPAAQRAAHVLAQTWATLAATSPVLQGDPVPDDLPGIQQRLETRLKLADGPIQTFLAHQVAILDLMGYITVSEQSKARSEATELIDKSAESRSRMGSVLEQAVETERAIVKMWKLRMPIDEAVGSRKQDISP